MTDRLTPADVDAVRDLVARATEADGVKPLSEHVLLHLPGGGDEGVRHVLVRDGDQLLGYAHLDVTDQVEGPSAELVVHPDARRRGIGTQLVQALLGATPDGRLRLWAHGEHPASRKLSGRMGFERTRVLRLMTRPLDAPLPPVALPDGVTVRTFEPGRDEDAWLAVNARAFADHPEQGKWTRTELELREAEDWFDARGFFLAFRGDRLVGFHWTKVHGAGEHGHEPVGEVYVVGVDPSEQGRGLGPALTLLGLHHLRDRGLHKVVLYVDDDNRAAVRTYEKLGFTTASTDALYTRTPRPTV